MNMFRLLSSKKSLLPYRTYLFNNRSLQLVAVDNDVCSYPPIIDMTKEGQFRHERQSWYNSIKALPTVEQKLYELTVHHRPQQDRYMIPTLPQTYNGIYFQRYITRTHLIDHLPEKLAIMNVDEEFDEIADTFKETVSAYYFNNLKSDKNYKDFLCRENDSSKLVHYLISQCFKKLAVKNDYILESTIQQSPRLDSYWFHSGFDSPKNMIFEKNLTFQFIDIPSFIIRMKKPLNPILPLEDSLCATAEVPNYNFHPTTMGFKSDTNWITSVPGHWFDDPYDFPFLLVSTTENLQTLTKNLQFYDENKIKDSMGIMLSFGWLNAVATYQGFTPFHDLTYPLVSQAILTNGQDWHFFVYQLNTIAFHSDVDLKDRRNICWSSGNIRLFDAIENGEIKGFNDEVFKTLLKFLMNAPLPQNNVVLKPYLGEANQDEEEFKSMRYFYRRMYSQAPDPMAYKDEIPTWQKIYVYSKHAKPMPFVKMF